MGGRFLIAILAVLALPAETANAVPGPTWPEAVTQGRQAAEAVLGRTGSETCLQGKLMNAMVSVSDSCDIEGKSSAVCTMAEDFIFGGVVPLSDMDVVSERFLKLTATP